MRFLPAGIFHLLMVSAVLAQANGDIESIGFDHVYRPGCWTPMVVRLTPTSGAAFKGKIAVYVEDGDHDVPIFTRPISLTGNTETGGERTQRFWMYFIPPADLISGGPSPTEVNRKLRIYLTNDDSPPKQIARLLVKDNIEEIDSWNQPRGTKLVLCVVDQSRPLFGPYAQSRAIIGLKEGVQPVMIPIASARSLLPESVLGYDAVDAIVWCDADPGQLSELQRTALKQYIHQGGKLIVCQTGKPNIWEMVNRGLTPFLPVEVRKIDPTADVTTLKRLVKKKLEMAPSSRVGSVQWKEIGKGPYDFAVAELKPHSIVVETEEADGVGRPWLVRGAVGSGSVTWVAQDLGDGILTGRANTAGSAQSNEDFKWLYIWDRVFDWGNASQPAPFEKNNQPEYEPDPRRKTYQDRYGDAAGLSSSYHLHRGFLAGMEFGGKGAQYLGLAIVFFVLYWVAAGPGSYFYLRARKQAGQSWFVFAAAALIATGITLAIVKLVLRGPAQVRHASFVRIAPGEPAVVYSQFGLYIPRDGFQQVELKKTDEESLSYVTAFPNLTTNEEGGPPRDYEVPVFNAKTVSFYYRSTLKKLQARWIGELPATIEGSAKISPDSEIRLNGKLVNKTGRPLKNIYVVFRPRFMETRDIPDISALQDQILFFDSWPVDMSLDLTAQNARKTAGPNIFTPSDELAIRGALALPGSLNGGKWDDHWYNQFQQGLGYDDPVPLSSNFVLLSLFDHLPAPGRDSVVKRERWDIHRAALRDLDVSGALGAGQLVVLAQSESDSPLPNPIDVDGDPVTGTGTTYYQFILPLDRSALKKATIPPATNASETHAELSTAETLRARREFGEIRPRRDTKEDTKKTTHFFFLFRVLPSCSFVGSILFSSSAISASPR